MTTFAGQWGPEDFQSRAGAAVPDATVTVYELDGTTKAALFVDRMRSAVLANPLPTGVLSGHPGLDSLANGIFFVDPGHYVVAAVVDHVERLRTPVTVDVDPSEPFGGVSTINGLGGVVTLGDLREDVTAGAIVSGHALVSPRVPDGRVVPADPTDIAGIDRPLWITTGAAASGAPVEVLTYGEFPEPSWSWAAGAALYLGPSGVLTATVPTSPGFAWLRKVATALTPTIIQFDPSPPIRLT